MIFVGQLVLHVDVVVVDEHAGDVAKRVQVLGAFGHPPFLLDVDEVADLQADAVKLLDVLVDGEASKSVPCVCEEVVKRRALVFGGAQLEQQHRLGLADGELDEGGLLLVR